MSSIDAIVAALYDVISGPIGEVRDRDRFMSLFVEGARLIPVGPDPETGETGVRMLSPGDYWTNSADALQQIGFTETEIGRTTETFGGVTHAFSAYASYRSDRGDPESPFSRGVNSIQLLNDGERWWDRICLLGFGAARHRDTFSVHHPLSDKSLLNTIPFLRIFCASLPPWFHLSEFHCLQIPSVVECDPGGHDPMHSVQKHTRLKLSSRVLVAALCLMLLGPNTPASAQEPCV